MTTTTKQNKPKKDKTKETIGKKTNTRFKMFNISQKKIKDFHCYQQKNHFICRAENLGLLKCQG